MNEKIRQNLLHDINALFVAKIERIHADREWVEVELKEGLEITACDLPHLLTIAAGYIVTINIYPITGNQLAIFFKDIKWRENNDNE